MPKAIPLSKGPSPEKAREMLEDGTVHGRAITDRQRRFFGARASNAKYVKRGKRPRTRPR